MDEPDLAQLIVTWMASNFIINNNTLEISRNSGHVHKILINGDTLLHVNSPYVGVCDIDNDFVGLDARKPDFFDRLSKYVMPVLAIEYRIYPNERS